MMTSALIFRPSRNRLNGIVRILPFLILLPDGTKNPSEARFFSICTGAGEGSKLSSKVIVELLCTSAPDSRWLLGNRITLKSSLVSIEFPQMPVDLISERQKLGSNLSLLHPVAKGAESAQACDKQNGFRRRRVHRDKIEDPAGEHWNEDPRCI